MYMIVLLVELVKAYKEKKDQCLVNGMAMLKEGNESCEKNHR